VWHEEGEVLAKFLDRRFVRLVVSATERAERGRASVGEEGVRSTWGFMVSMPLVDVVLRPNSQVAHWPRRKVALSGTGEEQAWRRQLCFLAPEPRRRVRVP
jgi:hypothetical protein